ncbi:MAG: PaaI family thioesterase [Candidatus Sericytochromatia bacterium]|nr:PaaI family thioesterase [Candidatus Tanganyikabacteria bacterium]
MTFRWPADLPPGLLPYERTLGATLGIELGEVGPDRAVARLPVTDAVRQAYGALHGGAIASLAESITSMGTCTALDMSREVAFGQEISYSLLRTVWEGHVEAVATPLHKGRTVWVWDVRVADAGGRLVAVARCSIAVRPRRD